MYRRPIKYTRQKPRHDRFQSAKTHYVRFTGQCKQIDCCTNNNYVLASASARRCTVIYANDVIQKEGARYSSVVRAFAHGAMGRRIDPSLSYFSFQPVLHDWCNKGCGMCYPVCGMVHIKEPLLLIGKSSLCGGSGFPLSLSEWFFTIYLTPYNRK